MNRFYLGITIFSCSTGLLVGSSNTPVIGVFITAIFGIVVGVVSLFKNGNDPEPRLIYPKIGNILLAFSFPLIIGIYLGCLYRNYTTKNENYIPWSATTKPPTVYETLDWISVIEILKHSGYSNEEIKSIYDLRIEERANKDSSQSNYLGEEMPYYKMLSPLLNKSDKQDSKSRGPASE
ncbi:MAG TPA: hypothetical protein VK559_08835 [Ferruginibacter sp.]|nr:hypothetical protein [Ferruginibacter sp.]